MIDKLKNDVFVIEMECRNLRLILMTTPDPDLRLVEEAFQRIEKATIDGRAARTMDRVPLHVALEEVFQDRYDEAGNCRVCGGGPESGQLCECQ